MHYRTEDELAVKAANEFGLTRKTKIAGVLVFISDIHTLGLKHDPGLVSHRRPYRRRHGIITAWSPAFLRCSQYGQGRDQVRRLEVIWVKWVAGVEETVT
jgi:hypothetical protein